MTADDMDGLPVARIEIVRTLTDEDLIDYVRAEDSDGHELPLAEALGMMRLAEDTLIRSRLDAADEEGDE